MASIDVVEADDPLKCFSDSILNFYNHYCFDDHTFVWCGYHPKVSLLNNKNM